MADLIFISYSSKDVSVANQVVAYLENNGFQCWIAPRNITSGGDYTDMIDDAINSCRALVLIMSSKSIQSQWVKKELATAVSYNKTIIPFRINAVQLNSGWQFLLNNVQWIDATSGSTASHFPEIISGIDQSILPPPPKPDKPKWVIPVVAGVALLAAGLFLWRPWQTAPVEEPAVVDTAVEQQVEMPVRSDTVVITKVVTQNTLVEKKEPATTTTATVEKVPQKKEPVTQEVAKEPEPEPTPKVEEEVKVETKTVKVEPTAEEIAAMQALERYNRQFKKAKKFYDTGNYKDALGIFKTLKREHPSDSKLDPYIKECQKHVK